MDTVNNMRRRIVGFYPNCIQLGHGMVSGNGAPVQCLNEDQMLFIGIDHRYEFRFKETERQVLGSLAVNWTGHARDIAI